MAQLKDRKTGKTKEIKNLGWLLRNISDVRRIYITKSDKPLYDCKLSAFTYSDKIFRCDFASYTVCKQWFLSRKKRFSHVEIIDEM